jgi:UDP:flavonoid glycosyltransferase YjiC (YdhE family)
MADDVIEFARAWRPDLIVTDPITMVGPLLAEVRGIPLVHHLWGPQEPSLTKFAGYGAPAERWPDDLRKLFDRFGAEMRTGYSPFSVAPCPPSLQAGVVPTRHTIRYVPYNGSGVLPNWLGSPTGRPRACVSWTTSRAVTSTSDEHPVAALAAALAGLDVEVVAAVTASDRAGLGPAPAGVRIIEDLPLQAVLPTCVASVNTGGAGSTLTAAVSGVPQVIVPQGPGHAFNAERIAAAGAGVLLGIHEVDLDDLVKNVSAILSDDRWRNAAQDLKNENLTQPPLSEAVRLIEELV